MDRQLLLGKLRSQDSRDVRIATWGTRKRPAELPCATNFLLTELREL